MVLDDVAHRADRVVEVPAVGHVEILTHRDLHRRDELPIPDGLEDRVRETQVEDVLDRHLPEEVVDPIELRLVDDRVQLLVERARGREIVAERLLDDDACIRREACLRQSADDRPEERRRNFEIEDRELRIPERRGDLRIGRRIREVAVDVREPAREPREDVVVEILAGRDDRFTCMRDELLERPVVEGDTDDGAVEEPAFLEPIERAVRHDAREVARDPEDHESVRARSVVRARVESARPAHARIIPRAAGPMSGQPRAEYALEKRTRR